MAAEGSESSASGKVAAEAAPGQLAAGLTAAWLWLGRMEQRKKDLARRRQAGSADATARLGRMEQQRKASERRAQQKKRQAARSGTRADSRPESVPLATSEEPVQEAGGGEEAELRQRLAAAEARAAAAEAAAAEARAEVRRLREEDVRTQAECQRLRDLFERILEAGRCPVNLGLFQNPVVASDGQTYSRRAIERWLRSGHSTSPLTREHLQPELYTNRFAEDVLGLLAKMDLAVADDDGAESNAGPQAPEDAADPERGSLSEAIEREDEATALQLLGQLEVPGLNDVADNGLTSLHLALIYLPEVAVAILRRPDFQRINARADFPDRADFGWTALHEAAAWDFPAVCRAILARADFTERLAVNSEGQTASEVAGNDERWDFLRTAEDAEDHALSAAIRRRRESTALRLLRQQEVPGLNDVDNVGQTLLHRALHERYDLPEVALAIVRRDDFRGINAKTERDHFTALHVAARRGLRGVCQTILDRRDFTEVLALSSTYRLTAAEQADFFHHLRVRDVLRAAEDAALPETDVLRFAIRRRKEATALRLLQQPQVPGLNDVGDFGWTLLHQAIFRHLPDVAVAIVGKADFQMINARDDFRGSTALHMAAGRGCLAVCRAIHAREDFTELLAVDSYGRTASELADDGGHDEVRDFLRALNWEA